MMVNISNMEDIEWIFQGDDNLWPELDWKTGEAWNGRLQGLWPRGSEPDQTRGAREGGETRQHLQIPGIQVKLVVIPHDQL